MGFVSTCGTGGGGALRVTCSGCGPAFCQKSTISLSPKWYVPLQIFHCPCWKIFLHYRGMLELFRCAKLSFITAQPYLKFGISPVTWCRMTAVEFILEHLFSQHLCSLSHLLVNSTSIIHRSIEVFEYVDCRVII